MKLVVDISMNPNRSLEFTRIAEERGVTTTKLLWTALYGNALLTDVELITDNPTTQEVNKIIRFSLTHGVTLHITDTYTKDTIRLDPVYDMPKGERFQRTEWGPTYLDEAVAQTFSPKLTDNPQLRSRKEYENADPCHYWNYFIREHNRLFKLEQEAKAKLEHTMSFVNNPFQVQEDSVYSTQQWIIDAVELLIKENADNETTIVYPGPAMHTGVVSVPQENSVLRTLRSWRENLRVVNLSEKGALEMLSTKYGSIYELDSSDPIERGLMILSYLDHKITPDLSWIPGHEKVSSTLSEDVG